jgi:hypothetical protein
MSVTLSGDAQHGAHARGSVEGSICVQLLLHDPSYTDRLAAFLRSVGQRPIVSGPQEVEVAETAAAELEVYLRVWRVLYPDAEVRLVA